MVTHSQSESDTSGAAKRHRDPSGVTSDTIGAYLERVSGHELLTADDEVRLSRAMERGSKAQAMLGWVVAVCAQV